MKKLSTTFLIFVCLLNFSGILFLTPQKAEAITCGAGSDIGGGECRVFLTSGTSWTVPDDWNSSDNTIEVIGGGGGGSPGQVVDILTSGGGGGGGGAYSSKVNVSLTPGSVTYAIGAGGGSAASGGDTYFCNSTSNCGSIGGSAVEVGAKGGTGAASISGQAGGVDTSGVGTVRRSGGTGGSGGGTNVDGTAAGGGGGAAGPASDGADGGSVTVNNFNTGGGGGGGANSANNGGSTGNSSGGAGGNGPNGSGGGTGGSGNGSAGSDGGGGEGGDCCGSGVGGNGGSGTEWTTHGAGGGAGGAANGSGGAGTGGTYGGGGGGDVGATGGTGGAGLIVITYAPIASSRVALSKPPNNLGLVGYWSFNEGTSTQATDFSGNGNHGTLISNGTLPQWINGKRGKALHFNTLGYIDVGTDAALSVSGAVTVCAWFQSWGQSTDRSIVSNADSSVANGQYILEVFGAPGSNFSFGWADGTPSYELAYSADGAVELDVWYHGCGVRSAAGVGSVYLNGVDVTNTNSGSVTPPSSPGSTAIGRQGASDGQYWDGLIDEVRIYNRALSVAEIRALYGSGSVKFTTNSKTLTQGSSLENGLVGLWTFDGADVRWSSETAGVSYDRSGNNNTGTLSNMNRRTSVDGGKLGQALQFDGVDEYVTMGANVIAQGAVTMCAWVNASVFTSGQEDVILGKSNSDGSHVQYGINTADDASTVSKRVQILWSNDAGSFEIHSTTATITTRTWYHICGIRDSSGAGSMYIDGESEGITSSGNVTPTTDDTPNTSIGRSGDLHNIYWNGSIDDVRIYNRALTAAEVKQLYTLGQVRVRP